MTSSVFLELPHGGKNIPSEVKPFLNKDLKTKDLILDSDEFSDKIFNELEIPHERIRFDYWRAFVDINRAPIDKEWDGITKTHTCQKTQIYKSEMGLTEDISNLIIEKYGEPYRNDFLKILNKAEVKQVIFCHTMLGEGRVHATASDEGRLRPLFCLINNGDEEGNTSSVFASKERMETVVKIIEKHKDELRLNFEHREIVCFNSPFPKMPSRFPWEIFEGKHPFSMEINRELFRTDPKNIAVVQKIMNEIIENFQRLT